MQYHSSGETPHFRTVDNPEVGGATVATSETARGKAVRMLHQEYLKCTNDVRQYKKIMQANKFHQKHCENLTKILELDVSQI